LKKQGGRLDWKTKTGEKRGKSLSNGVKPGENLLSNNKLSIIKKNRKGGGGTWAAALTKGEKVLKKSGALKKEPGSPGNGLNWGGGERVQNNFGGGGGDGEHTRFSEHQRDGFPINDESDVVLGGGK